MAQDINRKRMLRRVNSDISDRLSRKHVHEVKVFKECLYGMNKVTETLWLAKERLRYISKGNHSNIKNMDGHQDMLCDRIKHDGEWYADREVQTRYLTNTVQKPSNFDTMRQEVYKEREKLAYTNGNLFAPTLPTSKTAESGATEVDLHCVENGCRSSDSLSHGQNAKLYTLQENRGHSMKSKTSVNLSKWAKCSHGFDTSKLSAEGEIRKLADTSFSERNTYREMSPEGRSPVIWMNVTDTAVNNYLRSIQRRSPNAYVLQLLKHRLDL